ncbi:MFS transporter [Bacillus pseudomycoides]|uniref:MFS transporter n=1 Tax=Bacillus pseudomycoides TaxID=64104 RepID=A0AA91VC63_9BACI|nr:MULTISPECIES: MFS transporter [Bacillus]PEB47534.1 MFS transporter [Bacillus sp. AFS098217]PED82547.1 MFS transporter [Bacillus pseudomycoides]PEU11548.1 MFS transporter [Bacillus sp. AFS014408]PEU17258.1 MFS transporter [Bacillus sp. AFS019443]PFW60744.1 MFS transporter [Bacillus sp. AFS075034]
MNDKGIKPMLFLLAIVAFFIGMDSLVVSPLIPDIAKSTATPMEKGGWLITSYALFYGLTAPFFGPISDKFGRKQMIVTGMLIFSIGTFCTGLTQDFNTILVFRALTGLSGAMIMPSIFALIGDKIPYKMRGMAMGMIMGAMVGSTVLGVPIGAFLTSVGNWQWTFYGIGILALLVAFIVIGMLPKTPPTNQIQVSAPVAMISAIKTAFTNSSVFFALLSTFLWTVSLQGMFSYIGVYYKENFDFSVEKTGMVIFFAGAGSIIGNVIGGKLSDKIGKKAVVSIATIIAAVGVVSFSLLTDHVIAAMIAHVLWSTSIGFGQSSLTALISELSPKVRGTVMALNSSAMYIGMMFASAGASWLLVRGQSFLAIGILCAIASFLVLPIVYFLVKEGSATTVNEQQAQLK